MSAYLVSQEHIDALIIAGLHTRHGVYMGGIKLDSSNMENADFIGQTLWTENAKSVGHRYNEPAQDVSGYKFDQRLFVKFGELDIAKALMAIDGYEYQACEHPEWKNSMADQFCDDLRRALLGQLSGYKGAWSIHSVSQIQTAKVA
jgi:hypothetical protein